MSLQPGNRQRQVKRRGRLLGQTQAEVVNEPIATPTDTQDMPLSHERHMRGAPIISGDATDPGRRPIWQVIARNGLSAVAILVLLWALFFSGWLNIRGVELKGSNTMSQADVQKRVDGYLEAHPLERNILFTKTDTLAFALKQDYPTIKKMNISRTLFLKLQVAVTESKPALLWQSRGERWVVAEDGRILRPATAEEKVEGTIVDTAQLEVKVGQRVGDGQFISFVRDSYAKSQDFGFKLQATSIDATTRELKALLDSGVVIRMDTTRDAAEQLRSARVTFDTAERERKPIKEYVDVRVPGRAFYK